MAMHNSSPRISGIMMSERISSGPELFYNGQRFLAVVAYLYIVNRRERLEEIVAQLVIVFYNQDAMQFDIVFNPEFSGKFQRNGGDIRFIEGLLESLTDRVKFLNCSFSLGKDDSDSTALAFGALNVYFSIVQAYQLPHQHQTDTASRYFGVDGICSTEVHLEQFSLFFGGKSYSIIFDF